MPVELTDMIDAVGAGSVAVESFLDLETGAVIPLLLDVRAALAQLDDALAADDAAGRSPSERIDWRQRADWLRQAVLEMISTSPWIRPLVWFWATSGEAAGSAVARAHAPARPRRPPPPPLPLVARHSPRSGTAHDELI